jgi:hypothetical protein
MVVLRSGEEVGTTGAALELGFVDPAVLSLEEFFSFVVPE